MELANLELDKEEYKEPDRDIKNETNEKRKIILDTNFLLIPVVFKVDIFEEIQRICFFQYELCIVEGTIRELERLVETENQKDRMAAKVALSLIESKNIIKLPMEGYYHVDKSLINWGSKGAIIATQDKDLKRELKFLGVVRIVLRNKRHLILEGDTSCITKKK